MDNTFQLKDSLHIKAIPPFLIFTALPAITMSFYNIVFLAFAVFAIGLGIYAFVMFKKPYTITFTDKFIIINVHGKIHAVQYENVQKLKIYRLRYRRTFEKVDPNYLFGTYRNQKVLCEQKVWKNGHASKAKLTFITNDNRPIHFSEISISYETFIDILDTFNNMKAKKQKQGENNG